MTRFDNNYEQVMGLIRSAGERGLSIDDLALYEFLDSLVVVACVRRGLKNQSLSWEGERLVYNQASLHSAKTFDNEKERLYSRDIGKAPA